MSLFTTHSAEVGSFFVRLALCPVLAALGILLLLVYPSGQNGKSHPGNGTTLVTLPFEFTTNFTQPMKHESTLAIQFLPINLNDPNAVLLALVTPIAIGFAYIVIQAQKIDETRKIESSSRADYYDRSWNSSFAHEMQEASRNAGPGDRIIAFILFSVIGVCCLAAWVCRFLDRTLGQAVPPSINRLEEFSNLTGGALLLGTQDLPWNYTREAWVCGWKGLISDPAATGQFSSSCTRIKVSYFIISAILLVVMVVLSTTIRPGFFDYETSATEQTVSIVRLRWKDGAEMLSNMKIGLRERLSRWQRRRFGRWTQVAADEEVDLNNQASE